MKEVLEFSYEKLYPYQKVGVEFLLSEPGVLLADEMGTGKTVQAASALQKLREEGELRRGLIIVPASLKRNWYEEVRRWAPSCTVRILTGVKAERNVLYQLPVNLLIASYEQIREDFLVYPPDLIFDVVVMDEAQRVKNSASSSSAAVSRIQRKRLWALTGTPLENRVEELQNLIRLIRPDLDVGGNREDLLEAVEGRFLRRKKKDLFEDLGEIVDKTIRLNLSPNQKSLYDELWSNRHQSTQGESAHILALITGLKQLCNFCPDTYESSKIEALKEILLNAETESGKVIIFSQYVEALQFIQSKISVDSDIFHGGLSSEEREQILSNFASNDSSCALLISLRAGGVGLNVPDATHVILFDRWWNPQLENQAIHRAHRLDRKETLLVYRFLIEDSIEERIVDLLHEKAELFDDYVEGAAEEAEVTTDRLMLLLDI